MLNEVADETVDLDQLEADPSLVPQESTASEATSLETPPNVLTDDEKRVLLDLIDELEAPEKEARLKQLALWKKLEFYWKNIHDIFWDSVAEDWSRISDLPAKEQKEGDADYEAAINIYKSHGESIIAALTASVPSLRYFPEDADNPDDISTAKTKTKISELIADQNEAPLLLLRLGYLLWNEGCAFGFTSHHTSKEYGVKKTPIYDERPEITEESYCPECGADMPVQGVNIAPLCQNCGYSGEPLTEQIQTLVPTLTGYNEEPKSRVVLQFFGPMNVKVPHKIEKLKESPYLSLETEHHYALLRSIFDKHKEKIGPEHNTQDEEKQARRQTEFPDQSTDQAATLKRTWLRPWVFEMIEDAKSEMRAKFQVMFPNGAYLASIEKEVVDYADEDMDLSWSATFSPTTKSIHDDPIGKVLAPIQDMRNETVGLTLETVRYAIPETFADPTVVNFDEYRDSKMEIGAIRPAKARPGQQIGHAFHTIQTATLSKEVDQFQKSLDADGQFVVGSYPSIYGGPNSSGSKTLGEYQESRQNALQRLGIPWKKITQFWTDTLKNSVGEFLRHFKEDEKFTKKSGNGFVNIWLRLSELQGESGHVRCENSEQFPVSWSQKRALLFDLIGLKHPALESVLFHPENITEVGTILGWQGLYIPGEDDRNQQLAEIKEMVDQGEQYAQMMQQMEAEGGMMDPMMGPGMMAPMGPEINPFDDDAIHLQVLKAWFLSDAGRDAKINNPIAYQMAVAHYMEHEGRQQQQMAAEAAMAAQQSGPPGQKPPQKPNGPVGAPGGGKQKSDKPSGGAPDAPPPSNGAN